MVMKLPTRLLSAVPLLVLALSPLNSHAQDRPPALVVKQGEKYEEMVLTKLDVDVRIHGFLAETTSTMTFHNPHDRVLEGDIYFPLPEGSTVNGYALDIEGRMVDGVAVEKERARVIFESIVRQGIDPGLIEWTRGNTFKTRIFPIPAKGSRTIRVRYVSEIQGAGAGKPANFRLPLNFKKPVAEFDLRVEVVRSEKPPVVAAGAPDGFAFREWRSSFVAETKQKQATLSEDLVVALPATDRRQVLVEKSSDGTTYFCVHDFPDIPAAQKSERVPRKLAVYWDASGSRAGRDHAREIEVLDRCIAHWASLTSHPIEVEVTLLRNRPEKGLTFTISKGGWKDTEERGQLREFLQNVSYDGGTNFNALTAKKSMATPDERMLLFTDGLSTFGKGAPKPNRPLYVFSADASADHVFMASVAEGSGGRYFNLKQRSDEEVIKGLWLDGLTYRGATAGEESADEVYPQRARPVVSRHSVAGRLKADKTEVVLTYADAGKQTARKVTVSASDAVEGDLLRRYWAQTKLGDLLPMQDDHRQEIVDLGKAHSLVTPFTSLLVLDSLEQYLQHRVLPPKSWPELRGQYAERIEQMKVAEEKTRAQKLAKVLPMWEKFCAWHGTEFKYAKDFRYEPKENKAPARVERNSVTRAPGAPVPRPAPAGGEAEPEMEEALEEDSSREFSERRRSDAPRKKSKSENGQGKRIQPGVALTPWDPKTPYIAALKKAKKEDAFARYLELRGQEQYTNSPAFFLDCAGFFKDQGDDALALQVLSNLAELELENPQLLRVLAHRLQQIGELGHAIRVFETVLEMRGEEPQSYRDLALALIARAEASEKSDRNRADLQRSIELLSEVVMRHWDRFAEIEIIALVEINRILPAAYELGITNIPLDKRLLKPIDCDMRITMTWDADNTDIDLHVVEPSGEQAYYGHNRTTIGGRVSRDFTRGYGPEEYMVRKAMGGTYKVKAKFYGSGSVKLMGGVTVQVNIYTHFGRPEQQCKSITVRLVDKKDMIDIGELEF